MKAEAKDFESVLKTPEGERFIWRVLSECGLFKTSFSAESGVVYFNEGKRQIGLWLLSLITEADEKAFIRMMGSRATEDGVGE